jgi:hypothetical protein
LGTPEPEPYSEYGSGSGYKEMKQKIKNKLIKSICTCTYRYCIGTSIGICTDVYMYVYI